MKTTFREKVLRNMKGKLILVDFFSIFRLFKTVFSSKSHSTTCPYYPILLYIYFRILLLFMLPNHDAKILILLKLTLEQHFRTLQIFNIACFTFFIKSASYQLFYNSDATGDSFIEWPYNPTVITVQPDFNLVER